MFLPTKWIEKRSLSLLSIFELPVSREHLQEFTLSTAADFQKVNVLGIDFAVVDYDLASDIIVEAANRSKSFSVFALPVHGIIENHNDEQMKEATRTANMIVPDGQPVRWCMNYFHKVGLKDRVYGPTLTLHVLNKANSLGLRVFLYGGKSEKTVKSFSEFILENYPNIVICGTYREDDPAVDTLTPEMVNEKQPHILLVGRGCPRQEKWISRNHGKINAAMMAVGAAFSFHAGETVQAPRWLQDRGLEWLHRLATEPRRLWKRYLVTNTMFLYLLFRKVLGRQF